MSLEEVKSGLEIKVEEVELSENDDYDAEEEVRPEMGDMENKMKTKHRSGRWTPEEDEVYMKYIVANEPYFISESVRRRSKVFEKLSKLLDYKRTSDQCRSHHAKMKRMTEKGTMEEIISYLECKNARKLRQQEHKKLIYTGPEKETQADGFRVQNNNSQTITVYTIFLDFDLMASW